MIEIQSIKVTCGMPGRFRRFLCEVRLMDPDQGIITNDIGMRFWKYDKAVMFEFDHVHSGMRRLERILTRELCK